MREITEKELRELYPSHTIQNGVEENYRLQHAVFEEEFSCNECGSEVFIRQDPKGYDATLGCLNPECDNEAVMR